MLTATVTMQESDKMGFRFEDCIARYVDTDRDPPEGYGEVPKRDKYGTFRMQETSSVSGMVGGAVMVVIYPEQFGITPLKQGEKIKLWAGPGDLLDGCLRAIKAERQAPEYII